LREAKWERELAALLLKAGKSKTDIAATAKSAEWMVKIVREMSAGQR